MKPLIYLTAHADQVKVYPGEFLGPAAFLAYRNVCRAAGATFDRTISANLIRLDLVPALYDALQASFTPKVSPEVQEGAKRRAAAIQRAQGEAQDRVTDLADKPYPFQITGINALSARGSFILADEMRLGKTPQALLAIPADFGALVICPASLKKEWLKASLRWRPDLRPRVLERFDVPEPGELLIINYERLPISKKEAITKALKEKDVLMTDALGSKRLDRVCLIADEAHYLKASKSGRTQRFRELGKAIRKAGGRTWGLTGTPMTNTPMDLLNLLTAFDLLKESFGNYIRFTDLMNGKQDYWGKWNFGEAKPGAIDALRRVMLRRTRKQVFPDLPAIAYEDVEVDVKESARRASDAARAAMVAAGVDLQAVVEGRQSLGGAQECVFTARRLLAEAKIPALVEIVERYIAEGQPLIVGSAHRAPIEALAAIPGCRMMIKDADRSGLAEQFQAGNFCVIGGTIKIVAVGFMLARAAHILLVDDEWTPDWHDQFVSRAWLIGKERGVLVKRLIAPDTVDQDHAAIIAAKRTLIAGTIDKAAGSSIEADPQKLMDLGGI